MPRPEKSSKIYRALFLLASLYFSCEQKIADAALILEYTVSYDGSTTTVANLASSNAVLAFMPLVGTSVGGIFGIAPGDTVLINSLGETSGRFQLGATVVPCAEKATQRITALENGVTWQNTTAGTNGTLNLSEQIDFPFSDSVKTTGSVRKGIDYEETTSLTQMIWNAPAPSSLLDDSAHSYAHLLTGSVTSYNHLGEIQAVFTDTVAVGVNCIPEPSSLLLAVALLVCVLVSRIVSLKLEPKVE
jgi:hypothetical protein